MAVSFWIFLDQICPKLIKVDQSWSKLIKLDSSPIKKCYYYFWFFGSDVSNVLARNSFLAVMAILQKLLFVQKYFCQIWSSILAINGFFQICLTSQSIESFGSPLMAESFQACFIRFWGELKTPKRNFEINWPFVMSPSRAGSSHSSS